MEPTSITHLPTIQTIIPFSSIPKERHKLTPKSSSDFRQLGTHPGFQDLVRSSWHNHIPLNQNLMQVRNSLTDWNIEHFSNIFKRENKLWAKIARIKKCLPTQNNPGLLKLEKKLQKELDLTLQQEELLWYQRYREEWIALGDRNTSYYHASNLVRNKRNMIGGLKNRAGEWISDPSQLESMASEFYRHLFQAKESRPGKHRPRNRFPPLSEDHLRLLNSPISTDEVKKATLDMALFKAPGPDGMHAGFYQSTWDTTGISICNFVTDFFYSGIVPQGTNDTLLVPVPKAQHPESL